jgi:hypothetical protein
MWNVKLNTHFVPPKYKQGSVFPLSRLFLSTRTPDDYNDSANIYTKQGTSAAQLAA